MSVMLSYRELISAFYDIMNQSKVTGDNMLLESLKLVLGGMAMVILSLFFVYLKRIASEWYMKKKRMKNFEVIYRNKGFKTIKVGKYALTNEKECFPFSDKDIEDTLEKAEERYSSALIGLESIILGDRPSFLTYQVFGSYTPHSKDKAPEGAVIRLFPLERDEYHADMFRFYLDKEKEHYWLLTKDEARDEMMFTLAHEVGHNLIYNQERKLHGPKVEQECDTLASSMGCISREKEFIEIKEVYKDNHILGYVRDIERLKQIAAIS